MDTFNPDDISDEIIRKVEARVNPVRPVHDMSGWRSEPDDICPGCGRPFCEPETKS